MRKLLAIVLLAIAGSAFGQSGNFPALVGQRGTTTPTNCTVGQLFFDTDATAGSNVYGCTAANTWTLMSGGSAVAGCTYAANVLTCPTIKATTAFTGPYANIGGGTLYGSEKLTIRSSTPSIIAQSTTGTTTNLAIGILAFDNNVGGSIGGVLRTGYGLLLNGTSQISLDTSGGEQVRINNTASANRYITLTGSNGGNPTIATSAGILALEPAGSYVSFGPASGGTIRIQTNGSTIDANAAALTLTNTGGSTNVVGSQIYIDSAATTAINLRAGTATTANSGGVKISQTWTDGQTGNLGIVANFDMGATGTATGKLLSLQAGAAGTTEVFNIDYLGAITSAALKTTGAATGKNVVCVDTATGLLYASSTGTDCSN